MLANLDSTFKIQPGNPTMVPYFTSAKLTYTIGPSVTSWIISNYSSPLHPVLELHPSHVHAKHTKPITVSRYWSFLPPLFLNTHSQTSMGWFLQVFAQVTPFRLSSISPHLIKNSKPHSDHQYLSSAFSPWHLPPCNSLICLPTRESKFHETRECACDRRLRQMLNM